MRPLEVVHDASWSFQLPPKKGVGLDNLPGLGFSRPQTWWYDVLKNMVATTAIYNLGIFGGYQLGLRDGCWSNLGSCNIPSAPGLDCHQQQQPWMSHFDWWSVCFLNPLFTSFHQDFSVSKSWWWFHFWMFTPFGGRSSIWLFLR